MQEVKLWKNKKEQETYEKLGDLYAIIQTTERLERAFTRDSISAAEYEPLCEKLMAQYRTVYNAIRDVVPSVERFMAEYHMQCPYAATRLNSGLPATIEHRKPRNQDGGVSAVAVAETVQHFITCMDSLRLGLVAIDQVFPLLKDLLQSIGKISILPADFPPKIKIGKWHTLLYNLPASQELNETEVRQLTFDLDSSYAEFMESIKQ